MATLTSAQRQARASALNTAIGTSALLRIYTGTIPATPDTAASGTLLVTLTCNATAFGTASSGTITANAIPQVDATATGTAGYARLLTSAATTIMDLTVGTSGADVNINTLSLTTGGPVVVSSMSISEA